MVVDGVVLNVASLLKDEVKRGLLTIFHESLNCVLWLSEQLSKVLEK